MDINDIKEIIAELVEKYGTEDGDALIERISSKISEMEEKAQAINEVEDYKEKYEALRKRYVDRFMNPEKDVKIEETESVDVGEIADEDEDENKPMKYEDLFEEVKEEK